MSKKEEKEEEEIESINSLKESRQLIVKLTELAKTQNITLKEIDPKNIEELDDFETVCPNGDDWDEDTKREIIEFMRGVGKDEIPYYTDEYGDPTLLDVDKKNSFSVY